MNANVKGRVGRDVGKGHSTRGSPGGASGKEAKLLSRVQLFATPWRVAYEVPPSMEFPRQEYWSGLRCLLQGIFPTQGLNPCLQHCTQMILPFEPPGKLPSGKEPTCQCRSHQRLRKEPLEKGKATHSSILAWRIPWTEEPDGLQPIGLQSQT